MIVVVDVVVIHPRVIPHARRVVGQQEHQNPARVVVDIVAIDIGIGAIFNFDARHVVENLVVPHHNRPATLPDINRSIGNARNDVVFDEDVGAFNGIDSVNRAQAFDARDAFNDEIAIDDPFRASSENVIADIPSETEILNHKIVARGIKAVAAPIFAVQPGAFVTFDDAAYGNARYINIDGLIIDAGFNFNRIAR